MIGVSIGRMKIKNLGQLEKGSCHEYIGFGFVGPLGHFWYEGLDKFIKMRLQLRPKTARFVAAKVAMDGLIFGPFDLFVFFTYMGFCTGKNVAQVKEDVKRDFLPALIVEGGIWPSFRLQISDMFR
ncbi:hypothetical protein F3Y22_tig00111234pilonHSYRG00043 [Hibiscus syriacus]|uniref:Uncharacterized protein n=1 Tax=Hibiscus syriacus TaxID=106335 RepID=A0A6A2YUT4_HIBSY|nr:hypothetical protein F3Y22_tig00111234pilonHSYRG00043 [Hibiscus syriacus]